MFEHELKVVIGSLMKDVSSSILQVHVNLYGSTQQIDPLGQLRNYSK